MSQNTLHKKTESPGIISPTSPLEFLGFSVVSALVGLLSNANPIGFVAVPIIALSWWLVDRRRPHRSLRIKGISLTKESPQPAKGLILLVSAYSPRSQALDAAAVKSAIKTLLTKEQPIQQDFEAINLFESNLLPQIKAVEYHIEAGVLQELWLLPTEKSVESAKLLEAFLRWRFGNRLIIHCEAPIAEYDYENLFRVSDRIFQQSAYKEEFILADVTGGTKMMSVALATACIPQKRRMQYMDDGLRPVMLDIDPILYGQED